MSPTIALVSGWVILFVVAVCLVFVQVRFVRGVAAAAQKVVTAERDLNQALETQILAQNKELLAVYGFLEFYHPCDAHSVRIEQLRLIIEKRK